MVNTDGTLRIMPMYNSRTKNDSTDKTKPPMQVIITKNASDNINRQLKRSSYHTQSNKSDSVNIRDFIVHKAARRLKSPDSLTTRKTVDIRQWKR
jgi:hypothetical protein